MKADAGSPAAAVAHRVGEALESAPFEWPSSSDEEQ